MKKLFVFALLSLFLVSCIEYHEKMKLNYNGSGELTFAFGLNEALINMGGNDNKDLQDFSEDKIKESYKNKRELNYSAAEIIRKAEINRLKYQLLSNR